MHCWSPDFWCWCQTPELPRRDNSFVINIRTWYSYPKPEYDQTQKSLDLQSAWSLTAVQLLSSFLSLKVSLKKHSWSPKWMSLATYHEAVLLNPLFVFTPRLSRCCVDEEVGHLPDDVGQGQQGEMVDIATGPVPQCFHCWIICWYCKTAWVMYPISWLPGGWCRRVDTRHCTAALQLSFFPDSPLQL